MGLVITPSCFGQLAYESANGLIVSPPDAAWGFAFTITEPVILNRLGFVDGSQDVFVGLWSDFGVAIESAIITGSSAIEGNFRVEQVGEIRLQPGNYAINAITIPPTAEFYFQSSSDFHPRVQHLGAVANYNLPPGILPQPIFEGGSGYLGPVFGFTYLLGDVNQDGNINLLDVDPFIEVLGSGDYQGEADTNEDGAVNLLDIDSFIEILNFE